MPKEERRDEVATTDTQESKQVDRGNSRKGKPSGQKSGNRPFRKGKQDYKWYHISDSITKAVANIPFNVFPGTDERFGDPNVQAGLLSPTVTLQDLAVKGTPGVLDIDWIAYPGCSYSASSAVNVAARALYTWVRHQNSGHSNYESADLMMYMLAMDEVYAEYMEARRIYGILMKYSVENRNIPELLLEALNVDPIAFRSNLASFRAELNLVGAKISSLAVPSIFSLYLRHCFLASKVFIDSDTRRAQFYIFRKHSYRYYDPILTTTGGGLHFISKTGLETPTSVITRLNNMVDVLIADEDMNIMSGDILKAFGRESLFTVPGLDENYTTEFLFNEDVLQQIENSIAVGVGGGMIMKAKDGTTYAIGRSIGQADNIIYCGDQTTLNSSTPEEVELSSLLAGNVYFNSHKEEVNPADVIEWSRLMPNCTVDGNAVGSMFYGSESIYSYTMHYYEYDAAGTRTKRADNFGSIFNFDVNQVNDPPTLRMLSKLSQFDWHPIIYIGVSDMQASPKFCTLWDKLGDLKKYTLLAESTRGRLNDTAVMGELGSLILEKFTTVNPTGK